MQSREPGVDQSQWPSFYNYTESDPLTHALMSLLSMAPVTFSDAVGATNRSLVMMTCREDGLLLKPDRPATAIDAQFQAMMFQAWPGPQSSDPGHGKLFAAGCDSSNPLQRWAA